MTTRVELNEFQLDSIVPYAHILIIGKPEFGKLDLIKSIIKQSDYKNRCPCDKSYLLSPRDAHTPCLREMGVFGDVHYDFDDDNLESFMLGCELDVSGKKLVVINDIMPGDCIKLIRSDNFKQLQMNGRHLKITYIYSATDIPAFTPEIRWNFDYIFLFADDHVSHKKKLYDHYCGMFPTYESFDAVFKEYTQDGMCMVICNRGSHLSFTDKVMWCKVDYAVDCGVRDDCEDVLTPEEEAVILSKLV